MAARKTPSAGAKPDKLLRDALLLELAADAVSDDGKKINKFRRIAANLVKCGLDNKLDAIKEIWVASKAGRLNRSAWASHQISSHSKPLKDQRFPR